MVQPVWKGIWQNLLKKSKNKLTRQLCPLNRYKSDFFFFLNFIPLIFKSGAKI
jgi:hypothetical protein